MFLQLIFIIGAFLLGWILYQISEWYARHYLAFNSTDHTPIYTPGTSSASTLVCVLGWGGCTRRQLRRLLEFYSSHGIPTISWINPMYSILSGTEKKHIEHLLDFLLHENQTRKNILIHLHSNNGALSWSSMLTAMRNNQHYSQLLENIQGIILDSGPYVRMNGSSEWILPSAIGFSRACVSIILNRAQYFHIIWSPLMIYYLFFKMFSRRYFSSDPSTSSEKIRYGLDTIPTEIKQYYLYGDKDQLIPSIAIGM